MSSSTPLLYNLISTIIALVIIFLIIIGIKSDKFDKTVFSVIIGGALGNFYDRIYYKAVPDFIDLHYNDFHWFTFNVADVFISMGIIVYLVLGVFKKRNEKIDIYNCKFLSDNILHDNQRCRKSP